MLIWCPEAAPLAAGFGDGSGVPNKAKAAEPLPVQPRDLCGASILVRHHYGDGGLRVVHVEGAAHGYQFDEARGAVVVANVERKRQPAVSLRCLGRAKPRDRLDVLPLIGCISESIPQYEIIRRAASAFCTTLKNIQLNKFLNIPRRCILR